MQTNGQCTEVLMPPVTRRRQANAHQVPSFSLLANSKDRECWKVGTDFWGGGRGRSCGKQLGAGLPITSGMGAL